LEAREVPARAVPDFYLRRESGKEDIIKV